MVALSHRQGLSMLCMVSCMAIAVPVFSQSNINQTLSVNSSGATAHTSAQLDVSATDKGMLVPRMTLAPRTAIASPATGLLVFDTTTGDFWFYTGAAWKNLSTQKVLADADNDSKIQVEESPDEDVIRFDLGGTENMVLRKNVGGIPRLELMNTAGNTFMGENAGLSNTAGANNTVLGRSALSSNTSGFSNVAIGKDALFSITAHRNLVAVGDSALYQNGTGATGPVQAHGNTAVGSKALCSNTTGYNNTSIGYLTLFSNTNGTNNTAHGYQALYSNTTGDFNTAIGSRALYSNTIGGNNTANGAHALRYNTTGWQNTAYGLSALEFNMAGSNNTAIGYQSLYINETGDDNTATGYHSLRANTIGINNTANGAYALSSNTTASGNTAFGNRVLYSNTTGFSNTAIGSWALYFNTSGNLNTANGVKALYNNTTGDNNTATGYFALSDNTTGNSNTATGSLALILNTTGDDNTATGQSALHDNLTGSANTATGDNALSRNTTGGNNTADGKYALFSNTSGFQNTGSGVNALQENVDGDNNAAIGFSAGDTGSSNDQCTALGAATDVGTTSSYTNAIAVGYNANTSANNYARIGNTSVISIGGQVNWSNYSDGRFKRQVQEDVAGLDFITRLRPVTYQWDIHALNDFIPNADDDSTDWAHKYDIEQMRFTGFIAQEVEAAAAQAGFDFSGVDKPQNDHTPYALRYAEFVVPLVKAVQEQQSEIEKLKIRNLEIEKLEHENTALKAQVATQSAQLDKITAALQSLGIQLK